MFEINLVIKREYLRKRRIRTLITFICVLVVLGSVGIVALMGLTVGTQALTDNLADGNIDSKYEALVGHIDGNIEQSTLNKSDTEQVLTLQRQLQGLSSQATEKTMPSRIFAVLDTILPPNFVIGISEIRFDVDSNTLSIDGQAGTEGVDGRAKRIAGTSRF